MHIRFAFLLVSLALFSCKETKRDMLVCGDHFKEWRADSMGCRGLRKEAFATCIYKHELLVGLTKKEVESLLGEWEWVGTSKRHEYIIYTNCHSETERDFLILIVDFNIFGRCSGTHILIS